jgi:hypothetical protein
MAETPQSQRTLKIAKAHHEEAYPAAKSDQTGQPPKGRSTLRTNRYSNRHGSGCALRRLDKSVLDGSGKTVEVLFPHRRLHQMLQRSETCGPLQPQALSGRRAKNCQFEQLARPLLSSKHTSRPQKQKISVSAAGLRSVWANAHWDKLEGAPGRVGPVRAGRLFSAVSSHERGESGGPRKNGARPSASPRGRRCREFTSAR